MAKLSEVLYASVSTSGAATTLVAALATGKIRVVSAFLQNTTAQNLTFKSGAGGTALTGAMAIGAGQLLVLPHNPTGWFETAAATLLELATSGSTLVAGAIGYVQVDN